MKLCSRNRPTFLELNIYETSLDEKTGSGMASITPWTLNVQFIRMESNSDDCGPEANFEHDETLFGCFVS